MAATQTRATKKAIKAGQINATPPGASLAGFRKYVTAFEKPRADARRMLTAVVAMSVAVAFMAFAIFRMLPLHERIPYFVTVDPASAAVSVSDKVAAKYVPSQATERYTLAKWITDTMTVDQGTQKRLPESYAILRGAALTEWKAFIFDSYKPLEQLRKSDSTRVYPTIIAMAYVTDDSVAIRVALHSADGTVTRHLLVTVKFAIIPPSTDAEVYRNPAGLWITHFEVADEVQ